MNAMLLAIVRRVLRLCGAVRAPALVGEIVPRHPTPSQLEEGKLFVVRDAELEKWACFKCPGGCGEKIMLSLVPGRHPRWRVSLDWLKRPSVSPSIWQKNDC